MLLCLFWSRHRVCLFVFSSFCITLCLQTVGTLCDGLSRFKKIAFCFLLLAYCFVLFLFEISFQSSFTLKSIKRRLQINHLRNPLKRTKSCEVKMLGQSDDNILKETVWFNLLNFLLYESLSRPWNITNFNWNLNRHWMKS